MHGYDFEWAISQLQEIFYLLVVVELDVFSTVEDNLP